MCSNGHIPAKLLGICLRRARWCSWRRNAIGWNRIYSARRRCGIREESRTSSLVWKDPIAVEKSGLNLTCFVRKKEIQTNLTISIAMFLSSAKSFLSCFRVSKSSFFSFGLEFSVFSTMSFSFSRTRPIWYNFANLPTRSNSLWKALKTSCKQNVNHNEANYYFIRWFIVRTVASRPP